MSHLLYQYVRPVSQKRNNNNNNTLIHNNIVHMYLRVIKKVGTENQQQQQCTKCTSADATWQVPTNMYTCICMYNVQCTYIYSRLILLLLFLFSILNIIKKDQNTNTHSLTHPTHNKIHSSESVHISCSTFFF